MGERAQGITASLVALALGLLLGWLVRGTDSSALALAASAVEPLGKLWLNALQLLVLPLVTAGLLQTILRIEHRSEVSNVTLITLGLVLLYLVIGAATALLLLTPLLQQVSVMPGPEEHADLSARLQERGDLFAAAEDVDLSIGNWLLQLVPDNLFSALSSGELLPVIAITLLFGLALRRIEPDLKQFVAKGVDAVAASTLVLLRWVLTLTPVGVFSLAADFGATLGGDAASIVVHYIAAVCLVLVLATLLLYPTTSLLGRVSILSFARALLAAQIVALSTRSSLAALPALLDGGKTRLGLQPSVADLSLPLASSIFKFSNPITSSLQLLLTAQLFGIDLEAQQLMAFVITTLLISFSLPGIPTGGGVIPKLPAFIAAGVPIEAVILFEAVDAIPDIFKTLANVTGQMSVATVTDRFATGRPHQNDST
jgi:Na+/H+-dicarboxylate symporter